MLLFTSFPMNQAVLKAADQLEYHPEWVFSGMGAQDIEITARILNGANPEQMKHVFGLGNLPLYIAGIDDPQRVWFNWYWGGNQGIYSAATFGTLHQLNGAVSFAGPKLTPQTFQQGMFSMPLRGGAASKQLQSFMTGPRADARAALQRVLPGRARLRHHVVEPGRDRQGEDHLRRRPGPVRLRRRREALRLRREGRGVEEGRAQALRPEQLDLAVRRVAGVRPGAGLPVQGMPELRELTSGARPARAR